MTKNGLCIHSSIVNSRTLTIVVFFMNLLLCDGQIVAMLIMCLNSFFPNLSFSGTSQWAFENTGGLAVVV